MILGRTISFALGAAMLLGVSVGGVHARDLEVAVPTEATSVDPAAMINPNNATISLHIFETLIRRNPDMSLEPGLAVSWKKLDDLTWEFKLRDGVKWHDGSDFTADDVIATVNRIGKLEVPVSFRLYTRNIETMNAPDPHTVVFKTKTPDPTLFGKLSFIFITRASAVDAGSESFDDGSMAIGTGPYRFEGFERGQKIVVAKFADYWGEPARFDKITFDTMPNETARAAALLAGDVDVMVNVAPDNVPQLKSNPDINVSVGPQDRVIAMWFNFGDTTKCDQERRLGDGYQSVQGCAGAQGR